MRNQYNSVAEVPDFQDLCDQALAYKSGQLPCIDNELLQRTVKRVLAEDNKKALNTLYEAGLPLDSILFLSTNNHKRIGSLAVEEQALKCVQFLHSKNYDFCTNEHNINGIALFHWSIMSQSLGLTTFLAQEYIKKTQTKIFDGNLSSSSISHIGKIKDNNNFNIDSIGICAKNALHLALETSSAEIIDYLFTLPFEFNTYYALNDFQESPIVVAVAVGEMKYAQKLIYMFDTVEHYNQLEQNIQLLLKPNYGMVEEYHTLKDIIEARRDKLLLSSSIPLDIAHINIGSSTPSSNATLQGGKYHDPHDTKSNTGIDKDTVKILKAKPKQKI